MSSCFFHIYIDSKSEYKYEDIKIEMDKALDWFKYDSKNWIVYTSSNAEKWLKRLEKFVKYEGNLFICKFDINESNGWMNNNFWEWLRKDR
jgi:hypothetical protein